jgi:predicted AAA+ superfamily ATPase
LLERTRHLEAVRGLLGTNPVVAILGPRQVGKSTLARIVAADWKRGTVSHFDLESDADLRRLAEPSHALSGLRGLVIIDEIQRRPDLFPTLRVLADRPNKPARFLVLGSASPHLLKQTSETLAGRIAFHELSGFTIDEIGPRNLRRLWLRGGFPRSYTARSSPESAAWRRNFIRTFLERDLPQLDVRTPANALHRFWSMLAHVHGQTLNWSELGRSMGVADTTVRSYLDILDGALVVTTLKPWHENISKRQVKSPKVYVRDSGLLHSLLDIETLDHLEGHPKVGASWEGFVILQITRQLGARPDQCFYWATHAGAELDFLVVDGPRRRGFEVKLTDAPSVTTSMRIALTDLQLDAIDVIHGGGNTYPLGERVRAIAATRILEDIQPLRSASRGRTRT